MTTFDFREQLSQGHGGEARIIEYFKSVDTNKYVVDVTDDEMMQKRGVDFIHLSHEDFRWIKYYEIKTDTHKARNFFLELGVDGKPGWVDTCCADILVYYFPEEGVAFCIPMPSLRQWCRNELAYYKKDNPSSVKHVESGNGGRTWYTVGVTVPVGKLLLDIEEIELLEIEKGEG